MTYAAKSSLTTPRVACMLVFIMMQFVTVRPNRVSLKAFNQSDSATACTDGSVLASQDRVVIFGSVNATGTTSRIFDFFKKRTTGSSFISDCIIDVGTDGCRNFMDVSCYCQKNDSNIYTVVYNRTAEEIDSKAALRLYFEGDQSDTTLPEIRGPEMVTVAANGSAHGELSDQICNALTREETYSFEICATNLVNVQFYIGMNISSGSFVNGNSIDCGTFTLKLDGAQLTFAYRENNGCSRSNSVGCDFSGNNRRVSDDEEDCDTGCKVGIGCGVAVIVLGGIFIAVIYYSKRNKCGADHPEDGTPPNINVVVIIIKSKECLDKLAKLVIEDLGKKGLACKGKHVIKYKGVIEENRKTELASLFAVAVGVIKVTVNVCKDGIFEIVGVVSVAVLEISVNASESLDQLEDKVMDDLSKKHPDTKPDRLAFFLDGEKLNDMTITLGVLFTGLEDGMMLTVIVHLDGSRKCEIKGPEPTGSSSDSKLIKNKDTSM